MGGLLEAIAITAACKLRWPELVPGEASVMLVPLYSSSTQFIHYDTGDLEIGSILPVEEVLIEKMWTGREYVYIGYGVKSDCLVVMV